MSQNPNDSMTKSDTPSLAERREYLYGQLNEEDLLDDPLAQFQMWLDQAFQANIKDANAMAVATADSDDQPTVRTVLLKGCDADGFCWYTDYSSEKGVALAANPKAELLFHWREVDRQIRIRGSVSRLAPAQGQSYFDSRPRGSQLAAAASQQSRVVKDRAALEAQYADLEAQYADGAIPKPADWGGLRLLPTRFEFWQGRSSRLHDRLIFVPAQGLTGMPDASQADHWHVQRLQP